MRPTTLYCPHHFSLRKPSLLKALAGIIGLLFLTQDLLYGASLAATVPQATQYKIPAALGRIDAYHRGTSDKTIIFVQDAHDSIEAQMNIAGIIRQAVAKYAVKTVFEEGYEGPVPTDEVYRSFTEPLTREAVSYYLLDHLRIGGAEYAHINRFDSVVSRQTSVVSEKKSSPLMTDDRRLDFQLIGADSIKGHFENVRWFRRAVKEKAPALQDIDLLISEFQRLADEQFPKSAKAYLKLKQSFDAEQIDLLHYLQRARPLAPKEALYPSIDLLLKADQVNRPAIREQIKNIAVQALFEEMQRMDENIVEQNFGKKSGILRKSSDQFLKDGGGSSNLSLRPASRDLKADEAIFEPRPRLLRSFQSLAMTNISNAVIEEMDSSKRNYEIYSSLQHLSRIKRLLDFRMTPAELNAVERAMLTFDTKAMAQLLVRETKKSAAFSKTWEQSVSDAIQFYKSALERETAAETQLNSFLNQSNEKTALLVYGGFHRQGLEALLARSGVSYYVVSPTIRAADTHHHKLYRQLMEHGYKLNPTTGRKRRIQGLSPLPSGQSPITLSRSQSPDNSVSAGTVPSAHHAARVITELELARNGGAAALRELQQFHRSLKIAAGEVHDKTHGRRDPPEYISAMIDRHLSNPQRMAANRSKVQGSQRSRNELSLARDHRPTLQAAKKRSEMRRSVIERMMNDIFQPRIVAMGRRALPPIVAAGTIGLGFLYHKGWWIVSLPFVLKSGLYGFIFAVEWFMKNFNPGTDLTNNGDADFSDKATTEGIGMDGHSEGTPVNSLKIKEIPDASRSEMRSSFDERLAQLRPLAHSRKDRLDGYVTEYSDLNGEVLLATLMTPERIRVTVTRSEEDDFYEAWHMGERFDMPLFPNEAAGLRWYEDGRLGLLWIDRFALKTSVRGWGVGRMLIDWLAERARDEDLVQMSLEVRNPRMLNLALSVLDPDRMSLGILDPPAEGIAGAELSLRPTSLQQLLSDIGTAHIVFDDAETQTAEAHLLIVGTLEFDASGGFKVHSELLADAAGKPLSFIDSQGQSHSTVEIREGYKIYALDPVFRNTDGSPGVYGIRFSRSVLVQGILTGVLSRGEANRSEMRTVPEQEVTQISNAEAEHQRISAQISQEVMAYHAVLKQGRRAMDGTNHQFALAVLPALSQMGAEPSLGYFEKIFREGDSTQARAALEVMAGVNLADIVNGKEPRSYTFLEHYLVQALKDRHTDFFLIPGLLVTLTKLDAALKAQGKPMRSKTLVAEFIQSLAGEGGQKPLWGDLFLIMRGNDFVTGIMIPIFRIWVQNDEEAEGVRSLLVENLRTNPSPHLRAASAQALAETDALLIQKGKEPLSLLELEAGLWDADERVRIQIYEGLGQIDAAFVQQHKSVHFLDRLERALLVSGENSSLQGAVISAIADVRTALAGENIEQYFSGNLDSLIQRFYQGGITQVNPAVSEALGKITEMAIRSKAPMPVPLFDLFSLPVLSDDEESYKARLNAMTRMDEALIARGLPDQYALALKKELEIFFQKANLRRSLTNASHLILAAADEDVARIRQKQEPIFFPTMQDHLKAIIAREPESGRLSYEDARICIAILKAFEKMDAARIEQGQAPLLFPVFEAYLNSADANISQTAALTLIALNTARLKKNKETHFAPILDFLHKAGGHLKSDLVYGLFEFYQTFIEQKHFTQGYRNYELWLKADLPFHAALVRDYAEAQDPEAFLTSIQEAEPEDQGVYQLYEYDLRYYYDENSAVPRLLTGAEFKSLASAENTIRRLVRVSERLPEQATAQEAYKDLLRSSLENYARYHRDVRANTAFVSGETLAALQDPEVLKTFFRSLVFFLEDNSHLNTAAIARVFSEVFLNHADSLQNWDVLWNQFNAVLNSAAEDAADAKLQSAAQEVLNEVRHAVQTMQAAHFWFQHDGQTNILVRAQVLRSVGFAAGEAQEKASELKAALQKAYDHLEPSERRALFSSQKENKIQHANGEWMELPLPIRIVNNLEEEAMVSPHEITLNANLLRAPPAVLTLVLLHGLRRSLKRFRPNEQEHDAALFQKTLRLTTQTQFLRDFGFATWNDFLSQWQAWARTNQAQTFFGRVWEAPLKHARELVAVEEAWGKLDEAAIENLRVRVLNIPTVDSHVLSGAIRKAGSLPSVVVEEQVIVPTAAYLERYRSPGQNDGSADQRHFYIVYDLGDGILKVIRLVDGSPRDALATEDTAARKNQLQVIRDAQEEARRIVEERKLFAQYPELVELINNIVGGNFNPNGLALAALQRILTDSQKPADLRQAAGDILFALSKTHPDRETRLRLNRFAFDLRTERPLGFPATTFNFSAFDNEDYLLKFHTSPEVQGVRVQWSQNGSAITSQEVTAVSSESGLANYQWRVPVREGWVHYAVQVKDAQGIWHWMISPLDQDDPRSRWNGVIKFQQDVRGQRILSLRPEVFNLRLDSAAHVLVDDRGNVRGGTFEDLIQQLKQIKAEGFSQIYVQVLESGAPEPNADVYSQESRPDASVFSTLDPVRISQKVGGFQGLLALQKAAREVGLEVTLDMIPHTSRSNREGVSGTWVWIVDPHSGDLVRRAPGDPDGDAEWGDSALRNWADSRSVRGYIQKLAYLAQQGFNFRVDVGHAFDLTFVSSPDRVGMARVRGEVVAGDRKQRLDFAKTQEPNSVLAWILYEVKKAGLSHGFHTKFYAENWHGNEVRLLQSGVDFVFDPLVKNFMESALHGKSTADIAATIGWENRNARRFGGGLVTVLNNHDAEESPAGVYGSVAPAVAAATAFANLGILFQHAHYSYRAADGKIFMESILAEAGRVMVNRFGPSRVVNGIPQEGFPWNDKMLRTEDVRRGDKAELLAAVEREAHRLVSASKEMPIPLHTDNAGILGLARLLPNKAVVAGFFQIGRHDWGYWGPAQASEFFPSRAGSFEPDTDYDLVEVLTLNPAVPGELLQSDERVRGRFKGADLADPQRHFRVLVPSHGFVIYRLSKVSVDDAVRSEIRAGQSALMTGAVMQKEGETAVDLIRNAFFSFSPSAARWRPMRLMPWQKKLLLKALLWLYPFYLSFSFLDISSETGAVESEGPEVFNGLLADLAERIHDLSPQTHLKIISLPLRAVDWVSRMKALIREIRLFMVGGKARRQTIPSVSLGGYLLESQRSPWIISSARIRRFALSGTTSLAQGRFVDHFAGPMQRRLDSAFRQRRIAAQNVVHRIPALQHIQNQGNRNARTAKAGFPMANIGQDGDGVGRTLHARKTSINAGKGQVAWIDVVRSVIPGLFPTVSGNARSEVRLPSQPLGSELVPSQPARGEVRLPSQPLGSELVPSQPARSEVRSARDEKLLALTDVIKRISSETGAVESEGPEVFNGLLADLAERIHDLSPQTHLALYENGGVVQTQIGDHVKFETRVTPWAQDPGANLIVASYHVDSVSGKRDVMMIQRLNLNEKNAAFLTIPMEGMDGYGYIHSRQNNENPDQVQLTVRLVDGDGHETQVPIIFSRKSRSQAMLAILAAMALARISLLNRYHWEEQDPAELEGHAIPLDPAVRAELDAFVDKLTSQELDLHFANSDLAKLGREHPEVVDYLLTDFNPSRVPSYKPAQGLGFIIHVLYELIPPEQHWKIPVQWMRTLAPRIKNDQERLGLEGVLLTDVIGKKGLALTPELAQVLAEMLVREQREWSFPDSSFTVHVRRLFEQLPGKLPADKTSRREVITIFQQLADKQELLPQLRQFLEQSVPTLRFEQPLIDKYRVRLKTILRAQFEKDFYSRQPWYLRYLPVTARNFQTALQSQRAFFGDDLMAARSWVEKISNRLDTIENTLENRVNLENIASLVANMPLRLAVEAPVEEHWVVEAYRRVLYEIYQDADLLNHPGVKDRLLGDKIRRQLQPGWLEKVELFTDLIFTKKVYSVSREEAQTWIDVVRSVIPGLLPTVSGNARSEVRTTAAVEADFGTKVSDFASRVRPAVIRALDGNPDNEAEMRACQLCTLASPLVYQLAVEYFKSDPQVTVESWRGMLQEKNAGDFSLMRPHFWTEIQRGDQRYYISLMDGQLGVTEWARGPNVQRISPSGDNGKYSFFSTTKWQLQDSKAEPYPLQQLYRTIALGGSSVNPETALLYAAAVESFLNITVNRMLREGLLSPPTLSARDIAIANLADALNQLSLPQERPPLDVASQRLLAGASEEQLEFLHQQIERGFLDVALVTDFLSILTPEEMSRASGLVRVAESYGFYPRSEVRLPSQPLGSELVLLHPEQGEIRTTPPAQVKTQPAVLIRGRDFETEEAVGKVLERMTQHFYLGHLSWFFQQRAKVRGGLPLTAEDLTQFVNLSVREDQTGKGMPMAFWPLASSQAKRDEIARKRRLAQRALEKNILTAEERAEILKLAAETTLGPDLSTKIAVFFDEISAPAFHLPSEKMLSLLRDINALTQSKGYVIVTDTPVEGRDDVLTPGTATLLVRPVQVILPVVVQGQSIPTALLEGGASTQATSLGITLNAGEFYFGAQKVEALLNSKKVRHAMIQKLMRRDLKNIFRYKNKQRRREEMAWLFFQTSYVEELVHELNRITGYRDENLTSAQSERTANLGVAAMVSCPFFALGVHYVSATDWFESSYQGAEDEMKEAWVTSWLEGGYSLGSVTLILDVAARLGSSAAEAMLKTLLRLSSDENERSTLDFLERTEAMQALLIPAEDIARVVARSGRNRVRKTALALYRQQTRTTPPAEIIKQVKRHIQYLRRSGARMTPNGLVFPTLSDHKPGARSEMRTTSKSQAGHMVRNERMSVLKGVRPYTEDMVRFAGEIKYWFETADTKAGVFVVRTNERGDLFDMAFSTVASHEELSREIGDGLNGQISLTQPLSRGGRGDITLSLSPPNHGKADFVKRVYAHALVLLGQATIEFSLNAVRQGNTLKMTYPSAQIFGWLGDFWNPGAVESGLLVTAIASAQFYLYKFGTPPDQWSDLAPYSLDNPPPGLTTLTYTLQQYAAQHQLPAVELSDVHAWMVSQPVLDFGQDPHATYVRWLRRAGSSQAYGYGEIMDSRITGSRDYIRGSTWNTTWPFEDRSMRFLLGYIVEPGMSPTSPKALHRGEHISYYNMLTQVIRLLTHHGIAFVDPEAFDQKRFDETLEYFRADEKSFFPKIYVEPVAGRLILTRKPAGEVLPRILAEMKQAGQAFKTRRTFEDNVRKHLGFKPDQETLADISYGYRKEDFQRQLAAMDGPAALLNFRGLASHRYDVVPVESLSLYDPETENVPFPSLLHYLRNDITETLGEWVANLIPQGKQLALAGDSPEHFQSQLNFIFFVLLKDALFRGNQLDLNLPLSMSVQLSNDEHFIEIKIFDAANSNSRVIEQARKIGLPGLRDWSNNLPRHTAGESGGLAWLPEVLSNPADLPRRVFIEGLGNETTLRLPLRETASVTPRRVDEILVNRSEVRNVQSSVHESMVAPVIYDRYILRAPANSTYSQANFFEAPVLTIEPHDKALKMFQAALARYWDVGERDLAVRERGKRMTKATTVLAVDLPTIFYSPAEDYVRISDVIQISMRRRAILFSKKFLETLDPTKQFDINVVALYLNIGQTLIDKYDELLEHYRFDDENRGIVLTELHSVYQGIERALGASSTWDQEAFLAGSPLRVPFNPARAIFAYSRGLNTELWRNERERLQLKEEQVEQNFRAMRAVVADWDGVNGYQDEKLHDVTEAIAEIVPESITKNVQLMQTNALDAVARTLRSFQKRGFYYETEGSRAEAQKYYDKAAELFAISQKIDPVGFGPLKAQEELVYFLLRTGNLEKFKTEFNRLEKAAYVPYIHHDLQLSNQQLTYPSWLILSIPDLLYKLQYYRQGADVMRAALIDELETTLSQAYARELTRMKDNENKFTPDLVTSMLDRLDKPLLIPVTATGDLFAFYWEKKKVGERRIEVRVEVQRLLRGTAQEGDLVGYYDFALQQGDEDLWTAVPSIGQWPDLWSNTPASSLKVDQATFKQFRNIPTVLVQLAFRLTRWSPVEAFYFQMPIALQKKYGLPFRSRDEQHRERLSFKNPQRNPTFQEPLAPIRKRSSRSRSARAEVRTQGFNIMEHIQTSPRSEMRVELQLDLQTLNKLDDLDSSLKILHNHDGQIVDGTALLKEQGIYPKMLKPSLRFVLVENESDPEELIGIHSDGNNVTLEAVKRYLTTGSFPQEGRLYVGRWGSELLPWYLLHQTLHDVFFVSLNWEQRQDFLRLVKTVMGKTNSITASPDLVPRLQGLDELSRLMDRYAQGETMPIESRDDFARKLIALSEAFARMAAQHLGHPYEKNKLYDYHANEFHAFFEEADIKFVSQSNAMRSEVRKQRVLTDQRPAVHITDKQAARQASGAHNFVWRDDHKKIENLAIPTAVFLDAGELAEIPKNKKLKRIEELMALLSRHKNLDLNIEGDVDQIKNQYFRELLEQYRDRIHTGPLQSRASLQQKKILVRASFFESQDSAAETEEKLQKLKDDYGLTQDLIPLEYTRAGSLKGLLDLAESLKAEEIRDLPARYAVRTVSGYLRMADSYLASIWHNLQKNYVFQWAA